MKKSIVLLLAVCILAACEKSSSEQSGHSYSICPIQVAASLDSFRQVDYTLSGLSIGSYSRITVCFRRVSENGTVKSYSEITDTRDNPNTYQTYHSYKKLNPDETGVVVRWVDLTLKESGKTERYVKY